MVEHLLMYKHIITLIMTSDNSLQNFILNEEDKDQDYINIIKNKYHEGNDEHVLICT